MTSLCRISLPADSPCLTLGSSSLIYGMLIDHDHCVGLRSTGCHCRRRFPNSPRSTCSARSISHGSLSRRRREAHGITQPSASSRIRTLERQLGVTVLDRSPTGSRPTPDGQLVVGWAESVLDAAQRLATGVEALRARQAGLLRIAASYTIAEYLLPPWLERFLAATSRRLRHPRRDEQPDRARTRRVGFGRPRIHRVADRALDHAPSGRRHRRADHGGVASASVGRTRRRRSAPPSRRRRWSCASWVRAPATRCEDELGRLGYRSADVGARPRVAVGGPDRRDQRIGPDGHQPTRGRRRPRHRFPGRDRRRGAARRTTSARGVVGTHRAARLVVDLLDHLANTTPAADSDGTRS